MKPWFLILLPLLGIMPLHSQTAAILEILQVLAPLHHELQ